MKQSAIIGILAATDIAISFGMQLVIVTTIGLGRQMDALYACMVLPSLVLGILQSSLMHVLVPLLTVSVKESFQRDAWGLFLLVGAIVIAIGSLLSLLAPFWVPVIVPGFDAAARALVVRLTRIQMLATVIISELAVLSAILHARNRFIWPELCPLIGDGIGLVLLIWALPRYGIFTVVWLNVTSVAIQALLLAPVLGGFQRPDFGGSSLRQAWKRITPLLLGSAYYKSDVVVDRALSSLSRSGGFSLLYIGQQIYSASNQIVCKAFCAPIVPRLSELAKLGDWTAFRSVYRKRFIKVAGLMFAVYFLLLLTGERALRLVIGHGQVTAANVHTLWVLMALSAGVLIGGPLGQILSTTLYSTGNTRLPTLAGAASFTIAIFLKLALFRSFGLDGLALAISLYYALSLVLLMIAIRRVLSEFSSTSLIHGGIGR
jgi:putative peptidoglycan lipid II flippase